MSDSIISTLGCCREHCLDALEAITGTQPVDPPSRAALTMARCLKHVTEVSELETLYRDLRALADSARPGGGAPGLASGVGGL